MLRVYPGQSSGTASYSNPLHSAAHRICSCISSKIFHAYSWWPSKFNCKHGTFHVNCAPPASLADSLPSLCFNTAQTSTSQTKKYSRVPAPVQGFSRQFHMGGVWQQTSWTTGSCIQLWKTPSFTHGFSSNVDFTTLALRELTICSTKSAQEYFPQGDEKTSAFPIPFSAVHSLLLWYLKARHSSPAVLGSLIVERRRIGTFRRLLISS